MQPADETRDLYRQPSYAHLEAGRPGAAPNDPGRPASRTRQQAQVDQVLRAFGKDVGRGPANWPEVGVGYLYRQQRILVRDEYVDRVLAILNGSVVERSLIHGVTLVSVAQDTMPALTLVRNQLGAGVATPDHLVSIAGGEAGFCPATEPEVVPGWTVPDPVPTTDHRAGEGIRVVVVDTGLDPTAASSHPWLAGVSGDPDLGIAAGVLGLLTVGDGFLYLSLQERDNFAAGYFPLLYVGTNIAYLALAVPLGRLSDRVGRGRVLVAGHVALFACYLLASLPAGGIGLTLSVLLLLGVFYAATDGVLPALISRLVPVETRGSGIAAAQTVVALARFASSVLFGLLWSVRGPSWSLVLFAVLLFAAIPVAAWLLRGIDRAEVTA